MGDEGGDLLEFRILGPLEVARAGECLSFRGSRERALVALLAVNANRTVSAERLAYDLWDGSPPEGAIRSLRVYLSRLRQALGNAGHIVITRPSGYLLQVDPDAIDAFRFDTLVARGQEQAKAGHQDEAAATFRKALALWRGPALADVAGAPFARAEAGRLEEARLAALEARIDADLACGRHGELTAELEVVTREQPFREHFWAQRIVALYRTGRQADALRAYQELRHTLGEQLGIEPSEELRRLEGAVLRHDLELECQPAGGSAAAAVPPSTAAGVVTFLFTDVVSSTELLGELGDEAGEKIRQSHFGHLRAAISTHGGTEVKSLGDGLMVVFSSPLGALSAAVAMQQAVEANGRQQARPVQVRIGLHAGEPIRAEDDYYGTPVVVAKRLCDRAEGNQILASGLVCDLVGRRGDHGFAFRHLGALSLKGLPEPVPACEVIWRLASPPAESAERAEPGPLPLPLGREERVPLVGRSAELARLDEAWAAARLSERRLVLMGGEPGIGKSRLMSEFARRAHTEGALVIFGRCEEGMGVPYQPFVEALARYMRESPTPDLGHLAGELVRLAPEVAERVPGLPLPLRSDPETERYRLFEAVVAWLAASSAHRPLFFALDDLHWATKPTLLLLSHLIRSDEVLAVLLVATYRDSQLDVTPEVADVLAELLRQPGVERLRLKGLDAAGVETLVEAHARRELDDHGRALARVIHGETAGNPFFVREVLRHLAEKGDLVRQGDAWTVGQSIAEIDVPDSVREVVGRRLTRLPDRTDHMLALAAVLGEHFDLDVLAQAAGESADSVLETLDPAIRARLVEETAVGHYRFAHALVRSTLEDALGPTRRAQLHLRAAQALESLGGRREGQAAILATHYQQAGSLAPTDRVIDALIAAGDEAAAALAWEQVGGYWQRALEMMESRGSDARGRADVMRRLADVMFVAGLDLHSGVAYGEKALALYQELGDTHWTARMHSRLGRDLCMFAEVMNIPRSLEHLQAAEAALAPEGDSAALAYVYVSQTAARQWTMEPDLGLERAHQAIAMARRLDRPVIEALASVPLSWHVFSLGQFAEARATAAGAWEVAERLDHSVLGFHSTRVMALWSVSWFDPEDARRWVERELSRPRQAQAPNNRKFLHAQLAWIHGVAGRLSEAEAAQSEAGDLWVGGLHAPPIDFWTGQWDGIVERYRPVRSRYLEMGNPVEACPVDRWCAEAARLAGDPAGARQLQEAVLALRPANCIVGPLIHLDAAVAEFESGRPAEGRGHIEAAKAMVARSEEWRGVASRVALAQAMSADARDDLSGVEAAFQQAIDVSRRFGLPWEEAEAFLLWGRILQRRGDAIRAAERFDAAAAVYRGCQAPARWLQRLAAER